MDVEHYYVKRPGDLLFLPEDIKRLPEGTTLLHGGTPMVVMEDKQVRYDYDTRPQPGWAPSPHGETSLVKYPDGHEFPHETLEQFQWKVRDITLAAAQRHGVSGVPETLTELDVTDTKFPVGRGMRLLQMPILNDLSILPVDSLVSIGNPDGEEFSLFRRNRDFWVHQYGPRTAIVGAVVIEEVGGVGIQYDWLEQSADASVEPTIAQWKAKCWQVAVQAQRRHSWCGVFGQVMSRLGIDESSLRALPRTTLTMDGGEVTPEQAAAQPVGTMFRAPNQRGGWTWYVRSTASTNRAGTLRFAAWGGDYADSYDGDGDGHMARRMELVGSPGDSIRLGDGRPQQILGYLPNSTRFTWGTRVIWYRTRGRMHYTNDAGTGVTRYNASALDAPMTGFHIEVPPAGTL